MGALPQVKYSGKIREIKLGKRGCEVVVGGQTAYNFYSFEGSMPHPPKLALQVLDIEPEEWAPEALEPYKDVLGDPVAWATKCVDEFGADIVCLWLTGTDPNGKNLPAEHAAQVARNVAEAIHVPLIVWGVSSDEKNTEVLKAVAESCADFNVVLGPVTEHNYKQIGAAAIAYKHTVAANTPIDVNLAKQLNILLENLGVPNDRILIDPTTGSVGYGLEYCYSIMERIRQAALTQNDDKLQYPIINNIAEEVWKTKEAKVGSDENPRLGNPAMRGVNLEAITALSVLQAGSDVLILRHPKTLSHLRKYLSDIMAKTDLESMGVDLSLVAVPKEPADAKPAATPTAALQEPVSQAAPSLKPPVVEPQAETLTEKKAPTEELITEDVGSLPSPQPSSAVPEEMGAIAPPSVPGQKPAALKTPDDAESMELSDADIEALRELLGAFRAVKNLFTGVSQLVSGVMRQD
jgi:CO dehydrogenase/acetyl-CoA synthase delta subunit